MLQTINPVKLFKNELAYDLRKKPSILRDNFLNLILIVAFLKSCKSIAEAIR